MHSFNDSVFTTSFCSANALQDLEQSVFLEGGCIACAATTIPSGSTITVGLDSIAAEVLGTFNSIMEKQTVYHTHC